METAIIMAWVTEEKVGVMRLEEQLSTHVCCLLGRKTAWGEPSFTNFEKCEFSSFFFFSFWCMCWVLKANFFHLKNMVELNEKKWFGRNSCHYSDYFSKSAWRPGPCVLVPISRAGGGTQNSCGQQAHLLFIWLCCFHSLLDCDQSFWPHILESLSALKGNNIVERTLPSSANLFSMKESCQNALTARAFIYLLCSASGEECLLSARCHQGYSLVSRAQRVPS